MQYILLAIYIALGLAGMTLIKAGGENNAVAFLDGKFNVTFTAKFIIGFIFYIASFLLFAFVISKFDISYYVPLSSGITMVLIAVIGLVVFKEHLTVTNIIGIMLIIAGSVVMSLKSSILF
jgi:multidrug transporter EmrE-like cation transporter